MEELDKTINDIEEDEREKEESISDLEKGEDTQKVENDISEDNREGEESMEALRARITELEKELDKVTRERDEAHKVFLGQGKEPEKERNFENLREDIK